MTNLLERAELRKETFYKLTNSADVPTAPSGTKKNLIQGTSDVWSPFVNITTSNNWVYDLATVTYGDSTGIYAGTTINIFVYLSADEILLDRSISPRFFIQGAVIDKSGVETFTDWDKYNPFYNKWSTNLVVGNNYKIVKLSAKVSSESYSSINGFKISVRIDGAQSGKFHHRALMVTTGDVFPDSWQPAPEDLGWSATALVPTQQQRYLWKFEYIYYSDGSVEVTQPTNISIAGADGTNGKTTYIHFAYADDDKGTNFSLTDKNQQFQGYYSDYTEADSTDYTKYRWVDRLANVQVSTRNLWIQSKATGGFVEEMLPDNHVTGQKKCYRITNNAEIKFNIEPDFSPRLYRTVTFSAWVKYDNVVQGTNGWNVFNCFKHEMYRKNSSTGLTSSIGYETLKSFTGTSDWKYVTYTYDYAANKSYDQLKTTICFNIESAKSGTVWVTGIMVQFGNVATDHVWAPEDTQEQIDNKADQALTQDQLNALTEKNNLIKAEMEAKASIDTVNQWITAYQNYVKANDDAKDKSEKALRDASARLLKLNTDIGDLKQQWSFIDTYLTMQNEGLIIGKSDGSAYAKFSNDRISLFSGGSEVMYISQGVIRIENGIFTKTIQIGRFRFETHPADKDTLVLRYLGGV
ncbi:hypothetical protein Si133o_00965 [Streptococcus infantarius subsp. infantarius]|nr:hypothetical protein [Streptococcus infantarius subsp. infantarius]